MSRLTKCLPYLLLLLFPFALFSTTIMGGRALFWGTPLNQFVPWWTYSWESILSGVFPHWNPLLGMGAPLAANYQSALFYPLTWLYMAAYVVAGIGAMSWLMAVMVVLHLGWSALGMAVLIREMGLSRFAQVIAGLSFGLSGYLVARAGFLSINASAAWLPWIILGVTRLVKANQTRPSSIETDRVSEAPGRYRVLAYFPLLVIPITMQLLAGHAQISWYSLLLAGAWFVYLVYVDPWLAGRRARREQAAKSPPFTNGNGALQSKGNYIHRNPQRWLAVTFAGALLLAAALAAVQLLPTAQYLIESQRSAAVDYEFAMSYSFWPWRFLSFFAPGLFGNPALGGYWGYANYWEDAVYIGLIPFVLALAALLTRGKKLPGKTSVNPGMIGFLGVVILVVFLIAMGRNTPLFPWLYDNVPTFDMFQAPTRISILAIFALCVLAAIGADSWTQPGKRQRYWLRLGVMAAVAVSIGAGLALLLTRSVSLEIRPSFIRGAAWLGLWAACLGLLALKLPASKSLHGEQQDWGWWQWSVIIVIGLNLIVAGWGLNPSVELSVYSEPSPSADVVRENLAGGRLFLGSADEEALKFDRFLRFDTFMPFEDGGSWQDLRASLLPNLTVLDVLPSANNFDPLMPERYAVWMEELDQVDPQIQEQMLNLMGVTVVESIDHNQPEGIRFDAREAYPRIRWVGCGLQAGDSQEALKIISAGNIDHDMQVVLEAEHDSRMHDCSSTGNALLQVVEENSGLTSVKVQSASPGYIVFADTWFPGWQASVDGEAAELLRANFLFRAVQVPEGEHEVSIYFHAQIFRYGVMISLAALVVLVSTFFAWRR